MTSTLNFGPNRKKKSNWSFACTPPSGTCPPCPGSPPSPSPPYPPWCQARPWIMNEVLLRMSPSVITFLPKLILNRMAFINLVEFNYKHKRREIIWRLSWYQWEGNRMAIIRLDICQKIYTNKFSGKKFYTLTVQKLWLFLLKKKQ